MTTQVDPSMDVGIRASVQDVAALAGIDAAAAAVLDQLSSTLGLALWMVTRTAGDDRVVLRATGSSYGVVEGDVLRWSDSLCSRMVRSQGPRVAPRVADVEGYRDARIARELAIGSYVGIPLVGPDGGLFGTPSSGAARRTPRRPPSSCSGWAPPSEAAPTAAERRSC